MVIQPKAALTAVTLGPTLKAIQIGIIIGRPGRAALIVDAWRLAHPRELGRSGKIISQRSARQWPSRSSVASPRRRPWPQRNGLTTTVFAGGGDQVVLQGRCNILLLGGDAGRIARDPGRTA